jgi:shikimate dehydrogenase
MVIKMYGLIGKNLSHSFSKEIHNYFGNKEYTLLNTDNLKDIFENIELNGFNVTIPYKTEIIKYLDELDEIASKSNSVNTVIKSENKFIGYNTDYYGFVELIKYNGADLENKNILILGNGSVSNTIVLALKAMKAKSITRLGRTIKSSIDDYYNNAIKYSNYEILINTTPVGMFPNNDDDLLIDLDQFNNLNLVIDLIYNPLRTKLLVESEKRKIKAINGLYMLVMQAKKAHELFFNVDLPLNLANKIYKRIYKNFLNLVFIGLPLSGKSKYAKLFEEVLNKKLYDTDNEIEKIINTTIFDYFQTHTEKEFREIETSVIKDIYKNNNLIISTGGGSIKEAENIDYLKQNGVLVFLDRDPEEISKKVIKGRPLIKKSDDIIVLAEERMPLYKKACDISIAIKKDTVYHINEIKEKIDEYIGN